MFLIWPIASLVFVSFGDSDGLWTHLFQNVLFKYLTTTLSLMIGVLLLSLTFGITTAWIITNYAFPFKKFLDFINSKGYNGAVSVEPFNKEINLMETNKKLKRVRASILKHGF